MRGEDREVGTNKTGAPHHAPHPQAPSPHHHLLWGEWALTLPSWRFPSLLLPSQWPAMPGCPPPLPHLRCPCCCPWASCRGTQGGRGRRPTTHICSDLCDLNGLVATLREPSTGYEFTLNMTDAHLPGRVWAGWLTCQQRKTINLTGSLGGLND